MPAWGGGGQGGRSRVGQGLGGPVSLEGRGWLDPQAWLSLQMPPVPAEAEMPARGGVWGHTWSRQGGGAAQQVCAEGLDGSRVGGQWRYSPVGAGLRGERAAMGTLRDG